MAATEDKKGPPFLQPMDKDWAVAAVNRSDLLSPEEMVDRRAAAAAGAESMAMQLAAVTEDLEQAVVVVAHKVEVQEAMEESEESAAAAGAVRWVIRSRRKESEVSPS